MTTAYVSFYDAINDKTTRGLMEASAQIIAQVKPTKLYFLFSSTGGSVDAGVALYNFFRALPTPLVMHNTGSIDSIANVVFLAADERYANANSSFLFHGITWGFAQGANLTWTQLQETVSRFKGEEQKIIDVISQRTAITRDELQALFHQGEVRDTAFARDKGVVQAIQEAKVAPGSPFFALNFK